jgi:hypothetical protein
MMITAMPLVFSATGVIPNTFHQSLTTFNLPPRLLSQVQKMVVLNTSSIARKFLSVEVRLSDAEAENH